MNKVANCLIAVFRLRYYCNNNDINILNFNFFFCSIKKVIKISLRDTGKDYTPVVMISVIKNDTKTKNNVFVLRILQFSLGSREIISNLDVV